MSWVVSRWFCSYDWGDQRGPMRWLGGYAPAVSTAEDSTSQERLKSLR